MWYGNGRYLSDLTTSHNFAYRAVKLYEDTGRLIDRSCIVTTFTNHERRETDFFSEIMEIELSNIIARLKFRVDV